MYEISEYNSFYTWNIKWTLWVSGILYLKLYLPLRFSVYKALAWRNYADVKHVEFYSLNDNCLKTYFWVWKELGYLMQKFFWILNKSWNFSGVVSSARTFILKWAHNESHTRLNT